MEFLLLEAVLVPLVRGSASTTGMSYDGFTTGRNSISTTGMSYYGIITVEAVVVPP